MVSEVMREHREVRPTKNERFLGKEEVIVSKTDTAGVITYANSVFCRIAGYEQHELLGVPHNVLRHPDMPRCVFKFLWERISAGHEVFAYVKNIARNGDFYWVLAHVTPTYDLRGQIIGYHSNRRCPERASIAQIEPVYAQLRSIETSRGHKEGLEDSTKAFNALLEENKVTYDEFIFSIIRQVH